MVIVPAVLIVKLIESIPFPDNVPVPDMTKRQVPLIGATLLLRDRFPVIEIWFPFIPHPILPGQSRLTQVIFCGTEKPDALYNVILAVVVIRLFPLKTNDKALLAGTLSKLVIVRLFDNVNIPAADIEFQLMPLVANVLVPRTKVEPVVTTVPAVYVNVPVL